ncbi:MAG: dipeptidase [Syntrophomonadaceae bacterium]
MNIVDLHCDTISHLYKTGAALRTNLAQYDLARARAAGISLQFFAMFTQPAESNTCLREILKQLDRFWLEVANNGTDLHPILNRDDLSAAQKQDKIGCLLHLEGAECVGGDLEILRVLQRSGLRSLGLTWNDRNLLADGGGEGVYAGGLSLKGREMIKEMDRLGILLDLAHISAPSYYQALELYPKPVLVTHANARALCPHWRNLDDNQLKALAQKGGVVGITQVRDFVKEGGGATIDDMLGHIAYVADLVGVEHVGLGSDFDGADDMVLGEVGQYARMPDLLASKGFSPRDIEMISGGNAVRVITAVLPGDIS